MYSLRVVLLAEQISEEANLLIKISHDFLEQFNQPLLALNSDNMHKNGCKTTFEVIKISLFTCALRPKLI